MNTSFAQKLTANLTHKMFDADRSRIFLSSFQLSRNVKIRRTVISPVVLYGRGTVSLYDGRTLSEGVGEEGAEGKVGRDNRG